MDAQRKKLYAKLVQLHEDEAGLNDELEQTKRDEAQLRGEEEAYWHEHHQVVEHVRQLSSEQARLTSQLTNDRALLAQLEATNAYKNVFSIEDAALGIASINGLRLGRLSASQLSSARGQTQVEWPEVNAAWGQTAFLITVLAKQLGCTFSTYKIVPCGSFSTVERLAPDSAVYELYGTNDWQIGRLLHSRRFDFAMVGILECVHELVLAAEAQQVITAPPYTYVCLLTQHPQRYDWRCANPTSVQLARGVDASNAVPLTHVRRRADQPQHRTRSYPPWPP